MIDERSLPEVSRSRVGPPVEADPDEELVDRARRGDDEAFAGLVHRYERRVLSVARGLVGNPAEAEDVAQEVFLRVFKGLGGFRGNSTFKTWLYRIATNAARTRRGRRQARPEIAASGAADDEQESLLERAPAAGDLERATLTRDRVERALARLPVEWREAVVLRDLEGLDYREIAHALDIPIGTVESRIFRGRARLRELLSDDRSTER
jgi:RNA polymerase sigma-70 factor (ECF subfamily)